MSGWFGGGKKKEKARVYSGFPGDCSPEQEKALEEFRNHVQEKTTGVNKSHFDDVYLLRFLRARKFDLPKTIKMWDQFIEWRIKKDIDNYQQFKFPELPTLRKMYPHGYHKVDKNYRPIYIERVGLLDVEKIFKVMSTENMLQYYSVLYETLLTTIFDGCSEALRANMKDQQTGRVTQTITILDLKHVKLGSAGKAYDFVKPVSAMAQDNYPEILGNMFVVNAPMMFTGIWAMVKMWIDEKTKEKIKILGGSYKKELLEYVDPQNLPDFLDGGKCRCNGQECDLSMNIGPWNPEGKEMFASNISQQVKPQEPKSSQVQEEVKKQEVKPEQKEQVKPSQEAPKQSQHQQPIEQPKQSTSVNEVKQQDAAKQSAQKAQEQSDVPQQSGQQAPQDEPQKKNEGETSGDKPSVEEEPKKSEEEEKPSNSAEQEK